MLFIFILHSASLRSCTTQRIKAENFLMAAAVSIAVMPLPLTTSCTTYYNVVARVTSITPVTTRSSISRISVPHSTSIPYAPCFTTVPPAITPLD
ncbi:hypothetical protein BJ878DRAFT_518037 [Calycina marina]|uniref:Uncharacterized protein n=1 Tax=Calycina marina TaxID=1763456 RepID=A0A9P7YYD3_9HELO|nr:hypothetical protein BJ878DRAFT_518037 [Calycina marina]